MLQIIDRPTLQARLREGRPVLLEALPLQYYRAKHLPGALHFPHDQVDALAPQTLRDKSAEIVVYCANAACRNSHIAAHRLSVLGYTNVSVYSGGKQDWEDAGLPFDSESETV